MDIEFRLLGPLEVRVTDAIVMIPVGRLRAVLAALLLRVNEVIELDELAAMVWASPPPSARITLQNYVKRIRQHLGGMGREVLMTRPGGYVLSAGPGALDVLTFDALRRKAARAAEADDWRQSAADLDAALALWRGEPLVDVPECPLVRDERPRLAEDRLRALEAAADADLHLGHYEAAIARLRRLAAAEPFREHVHATLMLALYRTGRQSEALAVYRSVRRTLIAELGIEPGPELRNMHRDILGSDPALVTATTVSAPAPAPVPPRQLPPDLPDFCGREEQVRTLRDLLLPSDGAACPGVVATAAVVGPAGIGKTALAVHIAHRLAPCFPDGQLYVGLRGASAAPLTPGEVLARFLRQLTMGSDVAVPDAEEERSALYRSLLAGQRILVVLDDARDPVQVRPLLPGSGGCGVLVTSRNRLAGLEGCRNVNLDVMSGGEARGLLASIVGQARVDADPGATGELIDACAGLPLAVRIMGARLAVRPGWTIRTIVDGLDKAASRLDEMAVGTTAVRASFQVSYTALPAGPADGTADPARAFRLLGLAGGADISAPAATALLGRPRGPVVAALEHLVEIHLLESPAPGRYRFHDLIHLYAAELAAEEPAAERMRAIRRLLDWYLGTALEAARVLNPSRRHVTVDRAVLPGCEPLRFDCYDDALSWLDTEQANLVAAVSQASRQGEHDIAWQLPVTLWDLFNLRNSWSDWIYTHEIGLESVRVLGDQEAEIWLLVNLAAARIRTGGNELAAELLARALELNHSAGDIRTKAVCSVNLGVAYQNMERLQASGDAYERALGFYREISDKRGEGVALNGLGDVLSLRGDHGRAAECYKRSRAAFREAGDRYGEAAVQLDYSRALLRSGETELAIENSRRAVSLNREAGHRHAEAMSLNVLGQALAATGSWDDARDAQRCRAEASAIFLLIGDHDAAAACGN